MSQCVIINLIISLFDIFRNGDYGVILADGCRVIDV